MAPIISFGIQAVTRFAAASGPRGHLACKLPTQVLSFSSLSRPSAAISVSRGIVPSSLKIQYRNYDASEPKETKPQARITDKVYFDISIGGEPVKPTSRIVIGLYGDDVRDTAKKFRALCTGDNKCGYSYQGSHVHNIGRNKWIEGGRFKKDKGPVDESLTFKDENFRSVHDEAGVVSMNNKDQEFIISAEQISYFDDDMVVFGRVLQGMEVIKKIVSLEVFVYDDGCYRPKKDVVICACGEYHDP